MVKHFAVLSFILGWTAALVLGDAAQPFAGPFRVEIKQFEDCKGSEKNPIILAGNQLRRINRTTLIYSGDVHTSLVIDDNIKLELRPGLFGNGGWKEDYFVVNLGGICTAAKIYTKEIFERIQKNMGVACPIPPGDYKIRNLVATMNFKWPSLPYGKYKVRLNGLKDGKVVGCKIIYIDIVPKSRPQ